EMLHLPGVHVVRSVLGLSFRKRNFEPRDLKKWLTVALKARNHTEVLGKYSHRRGQTQEGLDVAMIEEQMNEGRASHAEKLQHARNTKSESPSAAEWAATMLNYVLKKDPTTEDSQKLASAATAAYFYDRSLWNLARTSNYQFADHDSDWVGRQQLCYLCDPEVYFITNEVKLRSRIAGSEQESRVLGYKDFLDTPTTN